MLGRREFLTTSAMLCGGPNSVGGRERVAFFGGDGVPAYSVVPVVGDGRWIWNEPPREGVGFLEPRRFRLRVGIELTGRGPAADVVSSTPAPISVEEQTIDDERLETHGGEATLETVAPFARRLVFSVPRLVAGQVASAVAHFELTLRKQYFAYGPATFPVEQSIPGDVRAAYLGDSPGIQTRTAPIAALLKELRVGRSHPWDLAQAAARWIAKNIRPQFGPYTSVTTALERRVGDCEEMAGVFVAVCRAAGIPARLVWIPNHVWSEFYLVDSAGVGRWIPVHTACYHWFGWTGVHELVLQKGDRLRVPGYGRLVRLQPDRTRASGTHPQVRYWAELTPLPPADDPAADAGPGARRKIETGEWRVAGEHPLDRYARR